MGGGPSESKMDKGKAAGLTARVSVPYPTKWGQSVRLVGEGAALGEWQPSRGLALECTHKDGALIWSASLALPKATELTYKFIVVNEGGAMEDAETRPRTVQLPTDLPPGAAVFLADEWQDKSDPGNVLATSAFRKVIFRQCADVEPDAQQPAPLLPTAEETVLRLHVWDSGLAEGDAIHVVGSLPSLGAWKQEQAPRMTRLAASHWQLEVAVTSDACPVSYQYLVVSADGTRTLEEGDARQVSQPREEDAKAAPSPAAVAPAKGQDAAAAPGTDADAPTEADGAGKLRVLLVVQNDGALRRTSRWRGSGVACPVFSLRTRDSVGVGEFLDINRLVDICCMAGMRLIQLLPVNDTSVNMMWWDSYPYSSLSVHALHPLYLSLRALTDKMPADLQAQVESAKEALALADVDYDGTMAAKMLIARQLFDREGAALLQTPDFKQWNEDNRTWLQPYAAFCFLRDLFGSAEHWKWGSLSHPSQQDLDRITSPERDFHASIQFVYYVQYQLHRQLLSVSQYAAQHQIVLKGDLPIGVDKRSVDTWMQPTQFRMHVSTGAPPDMFATQGQNWGFPTYQWSEMEKDGYSFWRRRLTHMSQYFSAYRIDHILGFFRIWEIPGDCVSGLLGHFRPSIPIRRHELESHGIWDIDRLCDPYVTWPLIQEEFGDIAAEVASKYFEENAAARRYAFRAPYSSEVAIAAIEARPNSPQWLQEEVAKTRRGLMRLRQNVVLLRNSDEPDSFFPRFQLMDTSSFRELDAGWRDRLAWLHDDYFYRRQEDLWRSNALRTLPVLMGATDMMVCGEDLGMIPACVHPVMERLGLLGLRIQRMPSEPGQEFGEPGGYPYMVVCSPSCHDTSTTRAWFEEDASRRERFCSETLGIQGEVPEHCTPEIMRSIVRQHLASPAMWCILPIQDMVALSPKYMGRPAAEETINDPNNPRHYWRYRIHYTLEDVLEDEPLISDLQALLLGSGRCSTADLPELHTQ